MELSPATALEKMRKYCAYQERSHHDVQQKMFALNIPREWKDDILLTLLQEDFLNEERFARAFVRGRFIIKKWGRIKIIKGLRQHSVNKNCIRLALQEIDETLYMQVLRNVLTLKNSKLKEKNLWKRRAMLYRFATQRGFEPMLINEEIRGLADQGIR